MSFSELEAIIHIFDEMDGKEGILVASKIADRVGITRSVIVNALRKFESAGVIESRSSGMKGTYIKVLNDVVFDDSTRSKSRIRKNKQDERAYRRVRSFLFPWNVAFYAGLFDNFANILYLLCKNLQDSVKNNKNLLQLRNHIL